VLLERVQHVDDCIPGIRPASHDDVSANLGVNTSFTTGVRTDVSASRLNVWGEYRWIEDADTGR
jgi:hypothetical protein